MSAPAEHTAIDTQSIDAWTAYWRTGRAGSCFEGTGAQVGLVRIWEEFVDGLADGARLVDLATGNGTVARSCAARARERKIRLKIEGVDAADIDPLRTVADPARLLDDVTFRGGVPLEALPFADASFDAAASQFGFEYADEERAVREIARVLVPGGRLRLVMHAHDGAVSQDIGRRLDRLRSVLAEHGPVTLVLALARAAQAGDAAELARLAVHLPPAVEIARKLHERPPPEDAALFYSREFLQLWSQRSRYYPSDLCRSLEQGWRNASGVASRQEQMLRAARSNEDVARISERFAAEGLIVDAVRLVTDERRGVPMAWMLDAHKE